MIILILVTASFILQPKSFTMIPFETKELCNQALIEAKKHWSTINAETKCLDLKKEAEIASKKLELEKLEKK